MRDKMQWRLILTGCLILLFSCNGGKKTTTEDKTAADIALKKKYAALLAVDEKEISNIKLYRFIDEWYGVPYKYGGKAKDGVDCSGFTTILLRDVYQKNVAGSAASLFDQCEVIQEKNLKEGDLVFFKINSSKISHVGVYLQNRRFVHASTKRGITINNLDEDYYQKYFYKGGRPK